jgi:hypothetical protein
MAFQRSWRGTVLATMAWRTGWIRACKAPGEERECGGVQDPGGYAGRCGVSVASFRCDIPLQHSHREGEHHDRQGGLDHQHQFPPIDAVGEDPRQRSNEEEGERPHACGNADPHGRVRQIPHQPRDGKLLQPMGRGITQVTEPEQHKIAISEGGKRLETAATALAACGNGLLRFSRDGDLMALLYAVIHSRPPALRV